MLRYLCSVCRNAVSVRWRSVTLPCAGVLLVGLLRQIERHSELVSPPLLLASDEVQSFESCQQTPEPILDQDWDDDISPPEIALKVQCDKGDDRLLNIINCKCFIVAV